MSSGLKSKAKCESRKTKNGKKFEEKWQKIFKIYLKYRQRMVRKKTKISGNTFELCQNRSYIRFQADSSSENF